jgi:hypothetical protein
MAPPFDPEQAWAAFEAAKEGRYPMEKATILGMLGEYYEKEGDKARVEDLRREWNLLNRCLVIQPAIGDIWQWCIEHICDPFPEWRKEDKEYYEKRVQLTPNELHKARYSYAAWVLDKRGVDLAHDAVRHFLRTAIEYSENQSDPAYDETMLQCFEIAFRLSRAVKSTGDIDPPTILAATFSALKKKSQESGPTYSFVRLAELVTEFIGKPGDGGNGARNLTSMAKGTIELAARASEIARSKSNYEGEQRLLSISAKLYSAIGDDGAARKQRAAIAESLVARAKSFDKDALVRSIFLTSATKLYLELGMEEEARQLEIQVAKDADEVAEKGFKTVTVSEEVPVGQIAASYVSKLKGRTPQEILKKISSGNQFIPDLSQVEETTKRLRDEYPLAGLLKRVEFDKGIPAKVQGESGSSSDADLNAYYLLEVQLRLGILTDVLDSLFATALKKEDILEFLNTSKNLSSDDVELIDRALDYYLSSDYLAFSHVITPRVEQEIVSLIRRQSGVIVSFDTKEGGFDWKLMGGLVRELKPYVDASFHKFMEIVFTQDGMNIRNRLSHGWMPLSQFNRQVADLLLYCLLVLSVL